MKKEEILSVLKGLNYPGFQRDIVTFGLIKSVYAEEDKIKIALRDFTKDENVISIVKKEIKEKLLNSFPVKEVEVEIEKEVRVQSESPEPAKLPISGVENIIPVASGKGGVGKTTVAVNIAVALRKKGFKTGILDADIYGPNVPIMLGLSNITPDFMDEKIIPIDRDGLKVISMGFFLKPDTPVIWRGPLAHRAIQQFLRDVQWGELDFLVVDLPPGTGDVQLTLVQTVPITGAIIVTTPQDVALMDARKGLRMFEQTGARVFGIIENMSYLQCPYCGRKIDLFRAGGGKRTSVELGIPLLAEIPLDPTLPLISDAGISIIEKNPESQLTVIFFSIADQILKRTRSIH
ncbi:MAG: Mrp/NBP35 family ATP-binding protein [Candidatus Aminicenantia bacterium]